MLTHQIKVRRKGQMTLPAEVRDDLEIKDGDVLYLRKENGNYILSIGESWVERSRGALSTSHPPIEPEQLEEIIEASTLLETFEKFGDPR